MGKIQINHNGSGSGITLSSDGTDLLLNGSPISGGGSALELYAENPTGFYFVGATGDNAVAIGNGALSAGQNGMSFGASASASGTSSVAVGTLANASNLYTTALGGDASATETYATALGVSSRAAGTYSTAIGISYASGAYSLAAAIGTSSASYGATGANSVAIGQFSKATNSNSIAIGDTAISSTANLIALGGTTDTVQISNTYNLPNTDGTIGQVMTTDGSGAVTFQDAGGLTTGRAIAVAMVFG